MTEFDQLLDKLAEVAVKIGLNLQPGQRLLIGRPPTGMTAVEAAPLVRRVAEHAYRAGARYVDVLWEDDLLRPIRLQNAPADSLDEYSDWQVQATLEYMQRGDASLVMSGRNPDLFTGLDKALVGKVEQNKVQKTMPLRGFISRSAVNWAAVPSVAPGWAAKVFPDAPADQQDALLWDAIFNICRVKQADPIAAWREHIHNLESRGAYLSAKQFDALHFRGPGTDLTIGIPQKHIWMSAHMSTINGLPFTANIPTEEVFTIPHRDRVEGVVTSTKPLNYNGTLIDKINLTFSGGRVVKYSAAKGEEMLRMLIKIDEGSHHLGEVSLVPHSSPISQSGLIFYNTLIDENAACHLALGHALKFNMQGGKQMTDPEFEAVGGNLSAIHVDFMVGSGEIDVDGITAGDACEPILRSGEWAFEV